jgi:hypothetical protein
MDQHRIRICQTGIGMMIYRIVIVVIVGMLTTLNARMGQGHGTPIVVTASAGSLIASGGHADSEGYAPQLFFEVDEQGDPVGVSNPSTVGPIIRYGTPGFSISGLNDSANLSMEMLAPIVEGASTPQQRVVWYWNPASQEVTTSVADVHFLGTGERFTTLSATSGTPPAPFELAATLTGQQFPDNHSLLTYGLDNDSPRPAGAYGFFARLTSNEYGASNPFLVVFNHQVDYDQMEAAALAINAAAAVSDALPGDFNHDGNVDASDYVVWRKPLLTDGGYSEWQANFGATLGSGGRVASDSVPEPSLSLLAVTAAATSLRTRTRRRLR